MCTRSFVNAAEQTLNAAEQSLNAAEETLNAAEQIEKAVIISLSPVF